MQHSTQEPKVKVWKPKAILVELFGTVTAAKWEDEVAFPYIVDNLEHFFNAHWNEPSLSELIANFKAESIEQRFRFEQDDAPIVADDEDDSIVKSTVVDYIKWQMRKRKESPSTIIVQRKIWQNGMKRGELKMHVFEDVKNAFNLWANEFKIQIYVFSAIDREDIKFLMSKTIEGDLTPFIAGYFGQLDSAKRHEASTFKAYADSINMDPKNILMITHIGKDAKAAATTGVECLLIVRQGNMKIRDYYTTRFDSIASFEDLQFVEAQP